MDKHSNGDTGTGLKCGKNSYFFFNISDTPVQETMEPAVSNFRYTKINKTDGANSQETQVNCVLECGRYTTHTFMHMNKDNINLKHVMIPTRRY